MGAYPALDRSFNFIHKIRITLQGALRPWCNSKFSTFIPLLSEHVTTSNAYLSREVCTNLQIKKIFASEALLHNLEVRRFSLQSKNIKKPPSQIYSF